MYKKNDFKKRKVRNENIILNDLSNNILINENIISLLMNRQIPFKKSKEKVKDDDLVIPDYSEYNNILNINYTLTQIKKIIKYYHLKASGNKDELKKRLYNYLYYSFNAIQIQKKFRRHLVKTYIYLHGPGFFDRSKCVNDTDFGTLDYIKDIPYSQFFSFKDEEDFIYAFDVKSIYNLYLKNNIKTQNPYSTKPLENYVFKSLMKMILYSHILNINIDVDYEQLQLLSDSKRFEMKILSLFQTMDTLGNYTNMAWFNSLDKQELIKFLRELIDIWNYRANLSIETKLDICPPLGNPFRIMSIPLQYIYSYNYNVIKKNIVNVMDEMINKGINNDNRSLGCYYVLSALTLVNQDAAEALPWLYDSVSYDSGI